ncbi:glycosyltransferase [Estrella lausannensis]|nr:glycosyltransferase [Estrella lausannensis]
MTKQQLDLTTAEIAADKLKDPLPYVLFEEEGYFNDYEYPKVTIVVPTYNCAQIISLTLETILDQQYPDFEVAIIDGGSQDRTLEVIKSFRDDRIRLYSVTGFHRYEMLNRGITRALGQYIAFLFPGDYYVWRHTLKLMMTKALELNSPDLIYCGAILRDGRGDLKNLYRPLTQDLLRMGQQPTTLQSCFFKKEMFKKIGKFDTGLKLRGGFDLLCRFMQASDLRFGSVHRILTDYDLRIVTKEMVVTHFFESMRIVYRYFGLRATLRWLKHQKDISRLFKLWFSRLKVSFLGR